MQPSVRNARRWGTLLSRDSLREGGRDLRLSLGSMHEDWALEARVFRRGARVFAIGSAGTTAMRLASRGDQVTAVDADAAQVRYLERRLEGAPEEEGAVDRRLARGRRLLRWVWAVEEEIMEFLLLEDTAAQVSFWRRRLDTLRLRAALALALRPRGLARAIRERLEEGFGRHPNRSNPYAWRLLLGRDPPGSPPFDPPPPGSVRVVHAEAAGYLEGCAPRSFDSFTLSSILDGASAACRARLTAALVRAAAPRAVVVARTLAEPADRREAEWARRDRSLIWSGIQVALVEGDVLVPLRAW